MRDPLSPRQGDASVHARRTVTAAGSIARITALTHDMRELVVRRDPGSPVIRAAAGQFAVLHIDGVDQPRPFSLARAPATERPDEHTFLVRLVAGGQFSTWLAAADRTGARLRITGALGDFVLDTSTAPMLCIAGGSGLSAIRAIVEHACNEQVARDCFFIYGARQARDLCLTAELTALTQRWHPAYRLEFVQVLSEEPPGSDWPGARGLVTAVVDADYLQTGVIVPTATKAYLCGPPPMVEAAVRLLTATGMPASNILRDVFEDIRSPAPVIDNRKCVLCDECLLVKPLDNCIVEASQLDYAADGTVAAFLRLAPGKASGLYYNSLVIDETVCIRCNACVSVCPHGAISTAHSRRSVTLRQTPGPH